MKKKFITLLILILIPVFAWASSRIVFMSPGTSAVPFPTDQFSANPVFSVGITATELDNEGTITVASNIATFSVAFPTNVGVGDVVQYDVDNSGDVGDEEYGIIHGISTDCKMAYLLKTDGSGVTNTTAATAVYDIFRAYISLANWESSTENTGIDADCRDDYGLTDFDLTDEDDEDGPLFVACYGDGADTTECDIAGWTTDADDYIEIFTPVTVAMVGVTQRHSGIWDDTKYSFETTDVVNTIGADYIRIDGLQCKYTLTPDTTGYCLFVDGQTSAANDVRLSNLIVRGVTAGTGSGMGIRLNDPDAIVSIWNTIVYSFVSGADAGFYGIYTSAGTLDIWNTTVNDCYRGICRSSGTATAKNTVFFENTDDIDGSVTLNYCATDDGDDSGNNGNITITQSADDYAAMVTDADGGDYSITDSSSQLDDAGTDDPGAAIQDDTDIAGAARVSAWDIGAFEL